MNRLFLIVLLVNLITNTFAQIHRCATHDVYLNNVERNPAYADAVEQAFKNAKQYAQNKQSAQKTSGTHDTIYRIPVVVHIVYNTPDQNIEDSLIHNQIEVLNQDYRRLNSDSGTTRAIFKSLAADAGIEFFLATEDPQGNPTTGITRTPTTEATFAPDIFGGGTGSLDKVKQDSLGGVDAWDTDNYLNIWVCNLEDANSALGLILGFAYPPDGAPNWPATQLASDPDFHGVVIHYKVFGRNNPRATGQLDMADRGRTATHEIGHYLGLRHIWGDGLLSIIIPDCSADDGISDTPNSGNNSQSDPCNPSKNTCTEGNPDLPDMYENYMDYAREDCQNMFTHEQVSIMRAMLATARIELPELEISVDSSTVGIGHITNALALQIYPNPSKGQVQIAYDGSLDEITSLTVHDLFGKELRGYSISNLAYDRFTLNLEEYPAGIYIIKAQVGGQSLIKRIVLEK